MSFLQLKLRIGEKIREARLSANISQAELARRAGLSRQYLCSVEKSGDTTTSTLVLILIALKREDILDSFQTKEPISPYVLAKLEARKKKRASSPRKNK